MEIKDIKNQAILDFIKVAENEGFNVKVDTLEDNNDDDIIVILTHDLPSGEEYDWNIELSLKDADNEEISVQLYLFTEQFDEDEREDLEEKYGEEDTMEIYALFLQLGRAFNDYIS